MKKYKHYIFNKVVLVAIIAIILGVVSYMVFNAVQKKRLENKEGTLADIVLLDDQVEQDAYKDTDGDRVPDWEEELWFELDPLKADSDGDGVSDYDYIRQKKREYEMFSNESSGITEKITESERLSRGLYIALSALSEQGEISDADREVVIGNVTRYIEDLSIGERIFTISDFYIIDNSYEESMTYKKELALLTEKYPLQLHEFRLIISAPENPDEYSLELINAQEKYKKYVEELQLIAVPIGISKQHIELTNIATHLEGILANFARGEEDLDEVVLLASLSQIETLFQRTINVLYEIGIYFQILEESDSWADQEIS